MLSTQNYLDISIEEMQLTNTQTFWQGNFFHPKGKVYICSGESQPKTSLWLPRKHKWPFQLWIYVPAEPSDGEITSFGQKPLIAHNKIPGADMFC